MRGIALDVRLAVRGLRNQPGVSLVTVAVLALGIGANTAVFSVVDALALRPLALPEPQRLVALQNGIMYADFADVRGQSRSFDSLIAHRLDRMALTGRDSDPETVAVSVATDDLFDMLRVAPRLGRTFEGGEDQPGRPRVAVVSHGLWQRWLEADPQAVGRSLVLDGTRYTVVGVMPPGFQFPLDEQPADVWVPLQIGGTARTSRQWRGALALRAMGRLAPGVTAGQAQAELDGIGARLAQLHPKGNAGKGLLAVASYDATVKRGRPALLLLLGAVAFVLLIACANVANLQLVRATARRRDMAVRAALGAGQGRIVRQLLTESLVLAAIGGGLGLLVAWFGVQALGALIPADVPRPNRFQFDGRVLLYTSLAALLTAVAVGMAPAFEASRARLSGSLRAGARGTTGTGRGGLRSLLLVSEVALALVLLVGAGLLVRSFARLTAVDPGFEARGLLVARIKAPNSMPRDVYYRALLGKLQALPGARSAAISGHVPFSRWFGAWTFTLDDRPPPPVEAPWWSTARTVSPGYFDTYRIPLLAGRLLEAGDDRPDAPQVVVINESFARRHWPAGGAIGRHIRAYDQYDLRIVGVVGKTLGSCGYSGCAGAGAGRLDRAIEPELIMPLARNFGSTWYLTLRAADGVDPTSLVAPLRQAVRAVEPGVSLSEVRTMEQAIDESLGHRRMTMVLLGLFAALALVLAALGIYGVMSYSVGQRTQEIGVRMALGAPAGSVRAMVVGQGLRLCLVGLGLGLLASLALTRLLTTQLYGVSPTDPATFAALSAVLLLVAALAALLPARRATRVDPMIALRAAD
jgi:putative ABC transport system permease protein